MSNTSETPPESGLFLVLPKLIGFARLIRNMAIRFKGIARFLALSGLLSALWLAGYLGRGLGFSAVAALLTGGLMLVPVALMGWCWFVLESACDLPDRLAQWLSRAKGYAGETVQRVAGTTTVARGKLGDLSQVGGLLYELRSMREDTRDLFTVFGGSLAFSNPWLLAGLALSAVLILVLDAGALVTGIMALL